MVSMGASVTIAGQPLPSSWDGSSMIALDDLSITWGRTDAYDAADAGTLALTVIDPTGDWAFSQALAGQTITVARTSDTLGTLTVFRGRITAGRPERRKVYNPAAKTREPVWIVPISAGDTLAEAASTVFAGEMGDGSVEGLGGWGEQNPEVRLTNVFARGGSRVFSGYEAVPSAAVADGSVWRKMHGQAAADQRSLLELIAQAYRLVPLGVVNYDPHANTVKVGGFAAASTVVLTYTGGVIGLQLPAGRIIDAGKVGVPDGIQGETTVSDAIDTVQVSYFWYGKDPNVSGGNAKRVTYTSAFLQRSTSRASTSGTSRVLKIDTELMFLDPSEFTSGSVDIFNRVPGWLADRVVEIVNTLNGQVRLPALRLDDRRLPLDQSTTDVLYRPYQSTTPLYFRGSVFNPMRNAGPQYQVIGGTLRYKRGWTHDLTVCPARNAATADPTITDLFGTTSDAQLGQFDADVRIGDLATITKGL